MPYHKSFIDQASSVKIAGYWPFSPFAFLWTWSIKTQKENLKLLTKRSVNHLYFERHCLSSSGCYKLWLIWLLITDKLHFFVCVYLQTVSTILNTSESCFHGISWYAQLFHDGENRHLRVHQNTARKPINNFTSPWTKLILLSQCHVT